MKTSTWLLIGGGALVAYLIYRQVASSGSGFSLGNLAGDFNSLTGPLTGVDSSSGPITSPDGT